MAKNAIVGLDEFAGSAVIGAGNAGEAADEGGSENDGTHVSSFERWHSLRRTAYERAECDLIKLDRVEHGELEEGDVAADLLHPLALAAAKLGEQRGSRPLNSSVGMCLS